MLFSMGTIAVILHRVLPWKGVAWAFARVSARNLSRLCGVRVRVHGLEHLQGPGPYIFAPNHQSNFDIAALLGYLPGENRFIAKKELFAEPVLGTVLRTMGMIPVDRDNPLEAIDRLNQAAARGSSLIIFPEGTRSRDGRLQAFKRGTFVLAQDAGVPVVPVSLIGVKALVPRGLVRARPGNVTLRIHPPVMTAGRSAEAVADEVRAIILRDVQETAA